MDDVFEWTFPSPKGLILPPPESTWDAQLIVEVVTAKAVAVAAAAAEETAVAAAAADIVVVTAMEVAEEAMEEETVEAVVAVMVVALLLLTTEAVLEGIIGPVPDPILLVGTDSIWGPRETAGGGYIFQIKLAHYQTFLFSSILPPNFN